ncbi:hypothetical protein C3432_11570 [Citrobacter amalonaticus]|uniref:Uncharacterized protein n=1 Tax=Citrobacter amalonaticus TaxID=35703 RepID=A0A2S4S0W9_CITAM|nr:hypothetical protein C3432_11570 [Citrobacter amalonaticus]POT75958.1 hypothetical protein C3436_00250 [Citrobacter amalonaticus]POU67044.1 hypothetical protein C3430_09770 [Citrobacter amalonaticus]POV05193.1 hypothetical protein C3424_07555 [Citrobacter amalonaticus]
MNTIPERFVLSSALYNILHHHAQDTYGYVNNQNLTQTIMDFKSKEPNEILNDLYEQILLTLK